jgi:predicted nicotinamide N-methyase
VSLATALMGANVVATDQAHMMPILERNIAANARPGMGPCKALELCWGSREGHGGPAKDLWGAWEEEEEEEEEEGGEDGECGGSPRLPDLVVAADCVYHPDVTALLIDTIDELVTSTSTPSPPEFQFLIDTIDELANLKPCTSNNSQLLMRIRSTSL